MSRGNLQAGLGLLAGQAPRMFPADDLPLCLFLVFLLQARRRQTLRPGDLIEISRFGYEHWAIYVGHGYVVHLAPPSKDGFSF